MRSKVLKIRNLPRDMQVLNEVKVKPISSLCFLFVVAVLLTFTKTSWAIVGVVLLSIVLFAFLVMPDRCLMQFTEEYLILYNCKDRDECYLIYWNEILHWRYIRRNDEDTLWIELVDGHIEMIECYNRSRIISYFKIYATGKEVVNRSRKKRVESNVR